MLRIQMPWRVLARGIGLLLLAYGGAVLLGEVQRPPDGASGWQHGLLLVFSPGLAFALAGIALALPDGLSPRWRWMRVAVGVMVIALPAIAVVLAWLPFAWTATLLGGGRLDTVLSLLVAGLALAALPFEKTPTVAVTIQLLSFAVMSLGLFALAVNALRIDVLSQWYGQAQGGLLTAGAVTLLGVALCVQVYDHEWRRIIHTDREDLKITLISGAILMFIVLSAGILGFGVLARQSEEVLKNGLAAALSNRVDLFLHIVNRAVDDAVRITHAPPLQVFLSRETTPRGDDIGHVIDTIAKTANASAIVLYDDAGRPVAQHGRLADDVRLRVPLPVEGGMSLLWARGRILLESRADLLQGQARVGTAVALLPLPELDKVFSDYAGLGRTGMPRVCAPHGADMQCFPSHGHSVPLVVPRVIEGAVVPVARALNGEAGMVGTVDYKGNSVLSAYRPIGHLGLGMALNIDKSELYQPLYRQFEAALLLLFVLVLLGMMLLRWQITPLVRQLMREIRERRRAQEELHMFSLAVEQSASMVMITDRNGVIEYVNMKFVEITGYPSSEVVGKTPRILQSGHTSTEEYRRLWTTIDVGSEWRGEFQNRKKNGELFWVYESISPIRNEEGVITHYLAVEDDVTARKHAEERLSRMAHFDGLTNLPNRVLFCDRLKRAMIEATESKRLIAVLFLDLDDFKAINDTLGHEAGDLLLKQVADRLTHCVRRGDTVARLGGDEFTIVLSDIAHVDDATLVAQKILDTFSQPFTIVGNELFVTASIGITLYPFHDDDDDVDNLIKNADVAMYRAKQQGRNNYQFYAAKRA